MSKMNGGKSAAVTVMHLPANRNGRDFAIGDLHGEVEQLREQLIEFAFDPACDRVFSVGDLIDRGTDSLGALALLDEPWFFAVRGNHEQMLIEAVDDGRLEYWINEWGDWAQGLTFDALGALAKRLSVLPYVIVVGTGDERFNVVHACLAWAGQIVMTDERVDQLNGVAADQCESLLWSRWMAFRYRMFDGHDTEIRDAEAFQPNLSLTFCGHTPLPEAGWLWSHYMIDGGAGCFASDLLPMPILRVLLVSAVQAEFARLRRK